MLSTYEFTEAVNKLPVLSWDSEDPTFEQGQIDAQKQELLDEWFAWLGYTHADDLLVPVSKKLCQRVYDARVNDDWEQVEQKFMELVPVVEEAIQLHEYHNRNNAW